MPGVVCDKPTTLSKFVTIVICSVLSGFRQSLWHSTDILAQQSSKYIYTLRVYRCSRQDQSLTFTVHKLANTMEHYKLFVQH